MLTPSGALGLLFSWNVQVGVAHYLSEVVALNVSTAWAFVEKSDLRSASSLRGGGTAHANVIWSPFKSVNTGVEYIYGLHRNYDGSDGTASRVQAMVKFIF